MATPVFEIRNPDGSMHLDLSKRVTRFIGTYTITTDRFSGTLNHPAFGTQGRPFFFPFGRWLGIFPGAVPQLTAHADRITWQYFDRSNGASPVDITILYGVY